MIHEHEYHAFVREASLETDRHRPRKAPADSRRIAVALVAHDSKKEALASFVLDHRVSFSRFYLISTLGTGSVLKRRTGLPIHLLAPGPQGGDRQLGRLAEENDFQAVIFFRDSDAAPGEPDFNDLLRVCDDQEIPLATNGATAEALLYFLENSPNRGAVMARPWGFAPANG